MNVETLWLKAGRPTCGELGLVGIIVTPPTGGRCLVMEGVPGLQVIAAYFNRIVAATLQDTKLVSETACNCKRSHSMTQASSPQVEKNEEKPDNVGGVTNFRVARFCETSIICIAVIQPGFSCHQ